MKQKIPNWVYIIGGLVVVGGITTLVAPRPQVPTSDSTNQPVTTSSAPTPSAETPQLKCDDVETEQRGFKVEVVSSDLSQGFGTGDILSYLLRVKVINNSKVTLPTLTIMSEVYDSNGSLITSSRAPSMDVHSVRPGDTVTIDHYAKGYIPG